MNEPSTASTVLVNDIPFAGHLVEKEKRHTDISQSYVVVEASRTERVNLEYLDTTPTFPAFKLWYVPKHTKIEGGGTVGMEAS